MNEHWDFLLTKNGHSYRVEVKARKRVSRNQESTQDKYQWIELHGVRENEMGWLIDGKADMIAFETEGYFLIITRHDLWMLVREMVDLSKRVTYGRDAVYKTYSRANRPDLLTLVETKEIEKRALTRWRKS